MRKISMFSDRGHRDNFKPMQNIFRIDAIETGNNSQFQHPLVSPFHLLICARSHDLFHGQQSNSVVCSGISCYISVSQF